MLAFRFFFGSIVTHVSFLFSAQKRAILAAGNEVPADCVLSNSEDSSSDEENEPQPGTSGLNGNNPTDVSAGLFFALAPFFGCFLDLAFSLIFPGCFYG